VPKKSGAQGISFEKFYAGVVWKFPLSCTSNSFIRVISCTTYATTNPFIHVIRCTTYATPKINLGLRILDSGYWTPAVMACVIDLQGLYLIRDFINLYLQGL
jgi:hypothetical protein